MSGRGRNKPNRGAAGRSQQTPKPGSGSSRAKAGPTPPRQAAASRGGASSRTERTQPVPALGSRRPPAGGGDPRRPPKRSSRETRHARDVRRKRNQRIGVLIGALALATALIGSRLAFQDAPTSAAAQNAPRTSSAPASSSAAATATTAASASSTPVTPMMITCPTGGGATTTFGHEIVVPEPYTVTISYGDGDKYTNDSAHLGAIFSHTYKSAGTYAVNAVLTAPGGGTATANCTYTWGP